MICNPTAGSTARGDAHLWWTALALALLVNGTILVTLGLALVESARFQHPAAPPPPEPAIALIFPDDGAGRSTPPAAAAVPPANPATSQPAMPAAETPAAEMPTAGLPAAGLPLEPRFARTSADQADSRPDAPTHFGERNTRATSDRTPDPDAPPLPAQAGRSPLDPLDLETTHSNYQDGTLEPKPATETATAATTPPPPLPTTPPEPADPSTPPATEPATTATEPADTAPPATPAARPKLLDGPHPVDVPVAREPANGLTKTSPPATPAAQPEPAPPAAVTTPPAAADQPEFRGFQRKTAITGSISRTGRSALDVEDSPLGRYQAALSRAVELEWQRNCVRHRDFITPGYLTVRFFVEPGGKVRSVQFIGDMETGEVQKGFTLNSIRDAAIPPMPGSLRKQYDDEPLELVFRFYF